MFIIIVKLLKELIKGIGTFILLIGYGTLRFGYSIGIVCFIFSVVFFVTSAMYCDLTWLDFNYALLIL